MTPQEALAVFEETTGLRIIAVHDPYSDALWWQEADRPDIFTCSVGDRTLHIDELSPTERQPKS